MPKELDSSEVGRKVPKEPQGRRCRVEEKQGRQQEQKAAGKRQRNGEKEEELALLFVFATEWCLAAACEISHSAPVDDMLDRHTIIYAYINLLTN